MIYKLLRGSQWVQAQGRSRFTGSPVDTQDGFIHFSTAAQAAETAAKYFAGEKGLVLAEVDPALLPTPLKWEPSRGGVLFPHLYGDLPLAAVTRTWVLALGPDGRHAFPSDLS